MLIHVILVMKLTITELHQKASVHAKEDIMKIQPQKNVPLATIHVKHVLKHSNVILVKITEKVNIVYAQMELMIMVQVQLNVSIVIFNV